MLWQIWGDRLTFNIYKGYTFVLIIQSIERCVDALIRLDESPFVDYAPFAFQQVHIQFWCAISWDDFVVFAVAVIRPDCAFPFAAGHPLRL